MIITQKRAWFGDGQANSVANDDRAADPVVLHEAGILAAGRYDDVGVESARLEAALGIQLS